MKINRIVNALEKAGLKVEKIDCNAYKKSIGHYTEPFWRYFCKSETHKCDFFPNGQASDCCCSVQVMRRNEDNDSQSDYFPGHFCRTIKDIVRSMRGE